MESACKTRPEIRSGGFTLIETVVVLLIFGIVVAMAAALTRGITASQKRSLTATRLAGLDAAMINFVAQQKRMPCPADGRLASSANNAGTEVSAGSCSAASLQHGVVPWRTLGLSETDATDGWDRRITYRLDPALSVANEMDLSQCDPAGGVIAGPVATCAAGCTQATLAACTAPSAFLNGKGLRIISAAAVPITLMDPQVVPYTGAAYVLISHGESGGGGYLNTGKLATSSSDGDGTGELKNYASTIFTSVTVTNYVDDSISDVAGASHFDDIVSRPSVMTVVTRAGLGPRAH